MVKTAADSNTAQTRPQPAELHPADRRINTAYDIPFGAGLAFFVVSFVARGVIPAMSLHRSIAKNFSILLLVKTARAQQQSLLLNNYQPI